MSPLHSGKFSIPCDNFNDSNLGLSLPVLLIDLKNI